MVPPWWIDQKNITDQILHVTRAAYGRGDSDLRVVLYVGI